MDWAPAVIAVTVTVTVAVVIGAGFIGTVAVRSKVRSGRLRLDILAKLMIAIAVVRLSAVLLVAAALPV